MEKKDCIGFGAVYFLFGMLIVGQIILLIWAMNDPTIDIREIRALFILCFVARFGAYSCFKSFMESLSDLFSIIIREELDRK